jgi:hypothetical protein
VTIALAFNCANGAVLCADTQMTNAGGFKFEESKILRPWDGTGWCACGTYAGSPTLAKSVDRQMYEDLASRKTMPSSDEFEDTLQEILDRVCRRERRAPLQMLWALSLTDHVHLFRTQNRTITDVLDFQFLGVGDCSLVRYLIDTYCFIRVPNGLRAAYYIASQAAKYVDGVGGPIEALTIYRGGRYRMITDFSKCKPPKLWSRVRAHIKKN